jgi:hypothetical protein
MASMPYVVSCSLEPIQAASSSNIGMLNFWLCIKPCRLGQSDACHWSWPNRVIIIIRTIVQCVFKNVQTFKTGVTGASRYWISIKHTPQISTPDATAPTHAVVATAEVVQTVRTHIKNNSRAGYRSFFPPNWFNVQVILITYTWPRWSFEAL